MSFDFTYGNSTINSSGGFIPTKKNAPTNPREVVDTYADIADIPNPYVGLTVTVKADETNNNKMTDYKVISLKSNNLGIADMLIDQVQRMDEYLGVLKEVPVEYVTETEMNEAIANVSSGGSLTSDQLVTLNKVPTIEQDVANLKTTLGDKNNLPSGDANVIASINRIDSKPTGNITDEQISSAVKSYISKNPSSVMQDKYYANAKVPLFIETCYEGGNQPTHPKIITFNTRWNGYKYWLSTTPYPYWIAGVENPHIHCSNDMIKWVTPTGVTNPIALPSETGENGYLSDSHLVYNSSTNLLECWYRHVKNDETVETIYRKTSSNGITWSIAEEMMSFSGRGATNCPSPAIIYDEGKYKIWVCSGTSWTNTFVKYYESQNGTNWIDKGYVLDENSNKILAWHLDVIKTDIGYEMVCVRNLGSGNWNITYLTSTSEATGFNSEKVLMENTKIAGYIDAERLYRPSLAKINGYYYLFYGIADINNKWQIGLSIATKQNDITSLRGIDEQFKEYMAKPTIKAKYAVEGERFYDKANNVEYICTRGGRETTWAQLGSGGSSTVINVKSVSIPSTLNLQVGKYKRLNYSISPSNATNKNVTWSASNENCTVVDGLVTAVTVGKCIITCTTVDGNKTSSCNVTVTNEAVETDIPEGFNELILDGNRDYKMETWNNHGSSYTTSVFSTATPADVKGYSIDMYNTPGWVSIMDDYRCVNFSTVANTTSNNLLNNIHDNAIAVRSDFIFIEINNSLLNNINVTGLKMYLNTNNIRIFYRDISDTKNHFRITNENSSALSIPQWGITDSCVCLDLKIESGFYDNYSANNVLVSIGGTSLTKVDNLNTDENKNTPNLFAITRWNNSDYLNISIDKSLLASPDLSGVSRYLADNPIEFSF